MHKLLKKSLNTVQDFVANPKVHQVSQLVNGAIKIASTIAQAKIGGPVAVASGVIAGIDVLQDTFGIEKPDPCKVFKDANDLIGYASSIPKIASELKLERFIKIESFAKNADFVMVGFKIDDKYACWQKPIKGTETAPATIIYTSSGFELSAISKAVNQALGHPVVIASLHTINGTGRIKLDALPYSDTKYLGVNDPASFSEEIEKFHQKGISRAALLWGLPGSGKTSYLKNYAKIADKTLFLIPPELINDHNARGELTSLIDLIRPDILVLDDLDWVSDTVLLFIVTNVQLLELLRRELVQVFGCHFDLPPIHSLILIRITDPAFNRFSVFCHVRNLLIPDSGDLSILAPVLVQLFDLYFLLFLGLTLADYLQQAV